MVPFHAVVVSVQVVMMVVTVSSIQFALLPDGYTIHWTMRNLWNPVTVSSLQECVDLAVAEEPAALAIYYYNSTGTCRWSTGIYGYHPRAAGDEPHCYLRTDNVTKNLTDSDCLTDQDAEYLIAKLSFGDEQCVDSTYDDASGLCVTKNYDDYGNYGAGCLRDGTQYLLTRDKALESVTYECAQDEFNTKMFFGGTWYCYEEIDEVATAAAIKDNKCKAALGSGSGPVKITEAREYGFMHAWWEGRRNTPYLGLYLQNDTTFVWYDGTVAVGLPWEAGRPLGDPANDMVYVTPNYTVADGYGRYNNHTTELLACKTPAAYVGYDWTVKFA